MRLTLLGYKVWDEMPPRTDLFRLVIKVHPTRVSLPMKRLHTMVFVLLFVAISPLTWAQRDLSGAAQIKLAIENLGETRSVLMIAAHPDDERTALLTYFARGRHVRTGYLSLTRGEGGQNLIGSEQGKLLGVIRTQELLAARKIDGAEQFFTRAIDFGFSKTPQESLAKWGHDAVLSDVVWVIRRFQPDVIVLVWSGTPRDGHGHHQASAIVGREAFTAAADKNKFPEQLKYVEPWQASRMFQLGRRTAGPVRVDNAPSATPEKTLDIDTGEFAPLLGHSYSEIAGVSRSMHRSQGMGAAEQRGSSMTSLVFLAGQPADKDALDRIDNGWKRLPNGAAIDELLSRAASTFDPDHPEKTIPLLTQARPLMAALKAGWAASKVEDLDEAIALCAGLWLDAAANRATAVGGGTIQIKATALNRSRTQVVLKSVKTSGAPGAPETDSLGDKLDYNKPDTKTLSWKIPESQPASQPFWLRKPSQGDLYTIEDQRLIGPADALPVLEASFRLQVGSEEIVVKRPIHYRYVDRVRGELTRPLVVVPPVSLAISEKAAVFPNSEAKSIDVNVQAKRAQSSGVVSLTVPAGWRAEPASRPFSLTQTGEQITLRYTVTPPAGEARGELKAQAIMAGGQTADTNITVIDYEHIPPQTIFEPATAAVVRADIRTLAHKVGYIMGAGDEVPQALRQIGCDVTMLDANLLARGDLKAFDAIVAGVRAYNLRPDLRANQHRLLDYVNQGGTYIVQYNTLGFGDSAAEDREAAAQIGPFSLKLSSERVTEESAAVHFPDPLNQLLQYPNKITAKDFEGWIQERGLYFATTWDPHYESLFDSHDAGEPPRAGGMLFARYGKGAYFYTGYSWFRELPAGVPGAFRIFANLLSAGKTLAGKTLNDAAR
jgi:LmbE family N-acetylglucosaminyl deacetylase